MTATATEFRADGWPLCPVCGEDELWSHLQWPSADWPDLDERPPMEAYLAAGLSCYRCGWSTDRATNVVEMSRAGSDSVAGAGED